MAVAQSTLPDRPSGTFKHYVYAVCYPSGQPLYIGCGQGDRIWEHAREARSGRGAKPHHRILRTLLAAGASPRYAVMFETNDHRLALKVESAYIRSLKPYGLITNKMASAAPIIELPEQFTLGMNPSDMTEMAARAARQPIRRPGRARVEKVSPREARPVDVEKQILIAHCLEGLRTLAAAPEIMSPRSVPVETVNEVEEAADGYLFAL